jgi:plastocyanin domain-containing protein
MMTIFINIIGILFIMAIIWWFWLSQTKSVTLGNQPIMTINVKDGVYQPASVEVPLKRSIILRFIREDATPCAEYVIFPSLNINRQLPLGKPVDIPVTLSSPGTYEFTCQMGMYRGKLVAKV